MRFILQQVRSQELSWANTDIKSRKKVRRFESIDLLSTTLVNKTNLADELMTLLKELKVFVKESLIPMTYVNNSRQFWMRTSVLFQNLVHNDVFI
jgi:hypothetical protein